MKQSAATSMAPAGKSPSKPAPTSASAPAPHAMGPEALSSLQSSLTGGAPLPNSTRKRLESSFRTDLGDVRVHTGGAAANATTQLHADAFASGRDIAFAPGRFAPGTRSGDHLIAEEVAHVVQQRSSGGQVVQRHATVSSATDSAEIGARAAADNIVAGKPANLSLSGLSTRGRIMRRARAGAATPSPVVAAPTNGLGTTKAGPAPVLTPTMTSTLSPAGGKLVDSAARKAAMSGSKSDGTAKAPDEAQTAQQGEGTSAPNVMTAGSPAGANADGPIGEAKPEGKAAKQTEKNDKKEKDKDKKDKDKKDKDEKDKKRKVSQEASAAAGGGGGGTFGKVEGDRGAGAAAAAQERLENRSEALATNEGADTRIGAAQAAAAPPANAADAAGQQNQTATLENADVPAGNLEAARSAMRGAVSAATPGTIEDLEDFASPGGASRRQPLTNAIAGQADAQTGPVRASLSAVDNPPAGAAPPPALPQPEPLSAPGSADPAMQQAVPPPVNESALDATEFKAEADTKLAEHDADDETLQKADEGPLREIGNDKNKLNDQVDQAAGRARSTEAQARDTARSTLAGAEAGAQAQMDAQRTTGQATVTSEQDTTRTGEEAAEQSLADQINTTYQTAQTEVNTKLNSLTQDAVDAFRERQQTRLEAFASGVRSDLSDLKRRRYSGIRGKARKLRDWFLSINSVPAVQRLYQRHRDQYISDIDAMITQIKADIDQTIADCKTALTTAREAIEKLVADNAGQMDQDAQAALTAATSGFAQMEQQIEAAADAAKRALDAERERAITEMDAELDKIRSENAGLVDKVAAAIAAVAAALGQFMRLMTRVTRMGIGTFLSAALSQAGDGVRNNLWGALQEAFKQWIFQKLPVLQVLLSLPPNWYEMLTALATNMIGLFAENLPALLPAIGTAAMIWLATTLAAKLIPGVGAIMAVIDGIRGAYALVQSLFSAASAFFEFVMKVADRGNGAMAFARALAFGIVAAVDAVLTFLGVDRLIQRVIGAIARPFGRIFRRIAGRFRAFMARRRRRRQTRRRRDRRAGGRGGANRRRGARGRARRNRRSRRRRRAARNRSRDRSGSRRGRRENAAERRRRRRQERERRNAERLRRAVTALRPRIGSLLARGVTGVRLRVQLAMWRVRYRIRKLAVQGRGRSARVVAGNSPDVTVREVLLGNVDGVYRMVHDIGMRRFRRASNGGSATPSIQTGDPPSRLGAQMRGRGDNQVASRPGRRDPENRELRRGSTVEMDVAGGTAYAAQGGGRVRLPDGSYNENAIGNVVVHGLGRYPEIARSMASDGISGPGAMQAVTTMLRTGSGSETTRRLIALLFGAEVARRPSAAASAPLSLAAMQNTPTARIFGDGGPVQGDLFGASDLDPTHRRRGRDVPAGGGIADFSADGFANADRRAESTIIDGRSFQEGTSIHQHSRAAVMRKVEMVYQAVRHMSFSDMAGLRREVDQLFYQFDRASGVRHDT